MTDFAAALLPEAKPLSEAEYRALPAMNWSTLSAGRSSLAHLKDRIDHPREDKECFSLGRATHCLVLEPGAFDTRWAVWSGADRRTKAGKAEWAKFSEENAGREIIDVADWDTARHMADAVLANRDVATLLQGGEAERVLTWTDADSGIACKGRADYLTPETLVDLKTTKDASPRGFARAAYSYGYFSQLAFYCDGAESIDQAPRHAFVITVETARPFVCQVYDVPPADLEIGRYEYRRLLDAYKAALASDRWQGYAERVLPLSVPRWAVAAMEVESESEAQDSAEYSEPF